MGMDWSAVWAAAFNTLARATITELDSIVIDREKKEATWFSKNKFNPSKYLILQMPERCFQVILDSNDIF